MLGLRDRGDDLSMTLKQLAPLHRDLARVAGAAARRRDALRRLVNRYGLLMAELGRHPAALRQLVSASGSVFDALAREELSISESVARLPATLRETESTLARVDTLAKVMRSALSALRPPIRELDETNAVLRPFLRETTPIVRDEIRPYVRAARPYLDDVRPAARDLAQASPDLTAALAELNRFVNIGAFNPGGAEPPRTLGGNDVRQEGFLYWLAWTSNNGVSLFNTADAQGVYRRLVFCGSRPASWVRCSFRRSSRRSRRRSQRCTPTSPRDSRAGAARAGGAVADGAQRRGDRGRGRHRGLQVRAMTKKGSSIPAIAAMVLFTLSVFGLLVFLWMSFGGVMPLKPQGYRFTVAFPEAAQLVPESEVRHRGHRGLRVKSAEMVEDGRKGARRSRNRVEVCAGEARHARDPASEEPAWRDVCRAEPGGSGADDLPEGGRLPNSQVGGTVELDEILQVFDPETRESFQDWPREAGIAVGGDYARDFNDSLGNLAPSRRPVPSC